MESMLSNPLAVRILSHADDKLMLGLCRATGPDWADPRGGHRLLRQAQTISATIDAVRVRATSTTSTPMSSPERSLRTTSADLVTDRTSSTGPVPLSSCGSGHHMQIVIKDLSKIDHESDLGARCDRILPEQDLQVTICEMDQSTLRRETIPMRGCAALTESPHWREWSSRCRRPTSSQEFGMRSRDDI